MEPILEVRNITKRFGGLTAVDNVDLKVFPGEVVAVLGDNGAGKSTLIKVISGVHRADAGRILFDGAEVKIDNPMQALSMGLETIYQDLALAENLNVYSNIFLGREKLKRFLGVVDVLDHEFMSAESRKVLDRLDIEVPSLRNTIRTLSGGQRPAVAISRAIYWNAKFLIMDEPTAALGVAEQEKVLNLVRTLSDQGVGIIIISHQMQDVFSVATRLMIMRRAKKVAERITAETTPDEVVGLIVGSIPGELADGNGVHVPSSDGRAVADKPEHGQRSNDEEFTR
jgi:ABC-type sugar transport system ATPase subunit